MIVQITFLMQLFIIIQSSSMRQLMYVSCNHFENFFHDCCMWFTTCVIIIVDGLE